MDDFPDREGQFAQREELSRAWSIVDNQTAEIEELEKRKSELVAALDDIREMCKPMRIDMSGRPIWFDGGTPAGGGSRERIWRICTAALDEGTGE